MSSWLSTGTQTRTVQCMEGDNVNPAKPASSESLCTAAKPPTSQACPGFPCTENALQIVRPLPGELVAAGGPLAISWTGGLVSVKCATAIMRTELAPPCYGLGKVPASGLYPRSALAGHVHVCVYHTEQKCTQIETVPRVNQNRGHGC